MISKKLYILLFVFGFLCVGLFTYRYFVKSWAPYYQKKLYKEPRPLLLKALTHFPANTSKNALDLGAGAGNDTAFLLNNNWHVWATDAEKEAIAIIDTRKDIQLHRTNLVLLHNSFIDMPWNTLPSFDFVYASYALPFAAPADFVSIWNHLEQSLKKDGIFAGNFFGPEQGGFNWWQKRNMTLLTKEQVQALFASFEIIVFEESHGKDDRGIFDHSFNVIARKL